MSPCLSEIPERDTETVSDPIRGRRVVRKDSTGRSIEVIRADRSRLRFEYDADGSLRRIDAGDTSVDVEQRATNHARLRDPEGCTDLRFSSSGWTIARDRRELSVERDGEGRPSRICIPGSPLPLDIEYAPRGCTLRYGGRVLARLAQGADGRRWRVGSARLEERCDRLKTTLSGHDRQGGARLEAVVWADLAGRSVRRVWSDGFEERFRRDALGRLASHLRRDASHAAWETREFHYRGSELIEETTAEGSVRRDLDASGRVVARRRSNADTTTYTYDARGRRSARVSPEGTTNYEYDGLDRLVRVHRADGSIVACDYDGLGRRLGTRGSEGIRIEHRDGRGRVWSVTDGDGDVLATYVWFEDRPLLHFVGPLGADRWTAYLCDAVGTPLLAVHCERESVSRITRLSAPPYGTCAGAPHPTLYGHFGDARTGLIHFGARELDPETGMFLTPESWHGGADDERRLGGWAPEDVQPLSEGLSGQHHAYALCRFDPVGRADYDGHMSVAGRIVRGLGNILLGPTWGMPLTSLSLFFFLPLDIYMEIVAGIVFIFIQRHPWKTHSLFGAPVLLASGRQAQLSFGLNGFLPRVVSGGGISADRAVTIGNVVWIRRHQLNVLDRPLVVDVEDISGAGGALVAMNGDPNKKSAVGLEITDGGKIKTHVSFWTRGYGNAIKGVGAPPQLAFDDHQVAGKRSGTIVLMHPVPFGYDAPDSPGGGRMVVREFVHDPAAHNNSTATLLDDPFFVLKLEQNKKEKLKENDPITVEASGVVPAHMVIGKILSDGDASLLVLFGELPQRFKTANITKGMTVRRLADDASRAATADWVDAGGGTTLQLTKPAALANWPPPVRTTDRVKVTATTPGAPPGTVGFPNPAPVNDARARIEKMSASVQVGEAIAAGTFGGATDVFLMTAKGKIQKATVKDPAKPNEIEFAASPDLEVDHYISIHPAAGADSFAKITNLAGKVATIDYLAAAPAYAGPTDVDVQRQADRADTDHPKATANAPSGAAFDVEIVRFSALTAGTLVRLATPGGGAEVIRAIADVTSVKIELSDPAIGTGPFTVGLLKNDPKLCCIKDVSLPKVPRFLKHATNTLPSAYGTYPGAVISVVVQGALKLATRFFAQPPPGGANFDSSYKLTWSPLQFGGDHWFVLDSDLPITEDQPGHFQWTYDADDDRRVGLPAKPAAGYTIEIKEFPASPAVRGVADAVSAHPAEVLVPADPRVSHTWGKALQEHEQRHTIQGNYFGPFLGNFPLTGLVDLAGIDQPDWFKEVFNDETGFQGYEAISLAGLLFGSWKLFLAPAFVSKSARDAILSSNFQGWNRLFNPFWSYIISKLPDLDVHHSITGDGFFTGLFRFIARATDLRFWTPLLGFVPLWYPDSGRNTLEQDASRESGDLYTTILTTDDKFNAKLTSRLVDFVRDDHDADVEKPLGSVFRLMMYPAHRWDRILRFDKADQAGADLPVVYNDEGSDREIVTITAPADTLFHPDLYSLAGGAPAVVPIEGPTSIPAPVDFLKLPAGASARPTLRTLVPLPPRVNRTAGLYFIPAQPAVYECKAFDRNAGKADEDALTQNVKLTVSGDVTFGSDPVTWQPPTPHPGVPAAPAFDRFVTEVVPLTVKRGKDALATEGFDERRDVTGAAAPNVSLVKNAKDWTFTAGDTATTVRVRLFRIFKKNDAANDLNNDRAFDLTFPDVPTLKSVRSYLEKDLWIPVRDFIVNVQDLPALANVAKTSDEFEDVELPLDVDAPEIAITPPGGAPAFPKPSRRGVGPTFARGRIWRFGPLGKTIEDPLVYRVEVTFGKPPITVNRAFDLTINPLITLQRAGAGAFEATTGTPLELTINGGTAPYTLKTENKPAGTDVTPDFANLRITVTVNAAPPAAQQVVVIVKDSKDKEGRRTVTVR